MKTTDLNIKGMHCNSCVMLLTDVLTEMDGVTEAKVSMGKATVTFDPAKATEEQMAAAIEAEGYKVE